VEAAIELRSTIGHGDGAKPAMDEKASAPSREQTRTADASDTVPVTNASVTMSDATPAGGNAEPAAEQSVSVGDSDTSMDDAKPDEVASSNRPVEAKSSEPAVKIAASASEGIKVGEPKIEAKAADVRVAEIRAEAPKADAVKSTEKPDESSKTATVPAAVPPATKDQDRVTGIEKAAASKADPLTASPKRSGQIAVFVSRKDSKLYVRQNFAPLFDVPVTIAPSDRPLGTHVFTAQADKNDANVLHWSVVSLPVPRVAQRNDEDERASRRRKIAGAVDVKSLPAPDSPAEALDRLSLPADALARIAEALSTGGSVIVSDQGIAAGETGEGTDFIVSLR
jgi:hypothetical protein